jgi:hypothetical protein
LVADVLERQLRKIRKAKSSRHAMTAPALNDTRRSETAASDRLRGLPSFARLPLTPVLALAPAIAR